MVDYLNAGLRDNSNVGTPATGTLAAWTWSSFRMFRLEAPSELSTGSGAFPESFYIRAKQVL